MTRAGWVSASVAVHALMMTAARADRREASVHAQAVGGLAMLKDQNTDDTATTPLGGLMARVSYATTNAYQYDMSLSVLATRASAFEAGTFAPPGKPPVTGPFTTSTRMIRLDGGVTFRLGVAWIPTVRIAGGVQARRRTSPIVMSGEGAVVDKERTGRDNEFLVDLVGVAALGLDHRVNRRFIVGVAAATSIAIPLGGEAFRTFEATAHASYYWYPR